MARRATRRAVAALVGLASLSTGCQSWRVEPDTAAAVRAQPAPPAHVFLRNGLGLELRNSRVTGDSLIGVQWPDNRRVAFALPSVAYIETLRPDNARTAVLGITVSAVAVALIIQLSKAASFGGCCTGMVLKF